MIKLSKKSQDAVYHATYRFLNECFDLDAETGALTWRKRPDDHFGREKDAKGWNKRLAGTFAGTPCRHGEGRRQVNVLGRLFLYHRIVYALFHKMNMADVPDIIDHADGDQLNSRPSNLRPADTYQSLWNRRKKKNTKSAFKGVSYHSRDRLWKAEIRAHGKAVSLGYFKDEKQAAAAYAGAAKLLHGDYYRPTNVGEGHAESSGVAA